MIKYKVYTEQWSVEFLKETDAINYQSVNGGNLISIEEEILENNDKIVPNEVSLWKIKAKLKLLGFDQKINEIINNLEEPQKTILLTAWEYAYVIDRWSNTTIFLQNELKLTPNEIDQIFIEANEISI